MSEDSWDKLYSDRAEWERWHAAREMNLWRTFTRAVLITTIIVIALGAFVYGYHMGSRG